MSRGTVARIDLQALQHNFQQVRSRVDSNSKIIAMVKADAYGHGLLPVADALPEADAFGVAILKEALALRQAGITQSIVVMTGFSSVDELQQMVEHDLATVVHAPFQLDLLESVSLKAPLSVWFKIDTGMHRLGFSAAQVEDAYQRLLACKSVKKPLCVMTHLADADNKENDFTQEQIRVFSELTDALDGAKSISNSAAIFSQSNPSADWVRPGIMLYGASPFAGSVGEKENLRPVMTLQSKLIAVKHLKKGDRVGYGCTWTCPEDMPVGVVAIGYGDGYPRHAKSGTPVLVNGVECPLVGRVSMDMITVDLRAQVDAKVGDVVTLWGEGLPVERIAEGVGTISYELLCQVTSRVPREVL